MHGLEPSGALRLAVRDLHKSYGSLEVLRGISLEAHQGDVIALIGASGSGKSTFLRCINQLEECSQGEIFVNGEHLDLVHRKGRRVARDPRQLRRIRSKLGFVFQSFNLWSHMTVLENLLVAQHNPLMIASGMTIGGVLGLPSYRAAEQEDESHHQVGHHIGRNFFENDLERVHPAGAGQINEITGTQRKCLRADGASNPGPGRQADESAFHEYAANLQVCSDNQQNSQGRNDQDDISEGV